MVASRADIRHLRCCGQRFRGVNMTDLLLTFVGLTAVASTAWAIRDAMKSPNALMGLLYSTFSMVIWIVFAYTALSVDVGVDDQGNVVTASYEPLALLGFAAALVMLPLVIKASLETLNAGDFAEQFTGGGY